MAVMSLNNARSDGVSFERPRAARTAQRMSASRDVRSAYDPKRTSVRVSYSDRAVPTASLSRYDVLR